MNPEHRTLKQRFLNGEALTQQEVMKLCRFEGDRWPLSLWQEEQALTAKGKAS
jgi:hypothetical protein